MGGELSENGRVGFSQGRPPYLRWKSVSASAVVSPAVSATHVLALRLVSPASNTHAEHKARLLSAAVHLKHSNCCSSCCSSCYSKIGAHLKRICGAVFFLCGHQMHSLISSLLLCDSEEIYIAHAPSKLAVSTWHKLPSSDEDRRMRSAGSSCIFVRILRVHSVVCACSCVCVRAPMLI